MGGTSSADKQLVIKKMVKEWIVTDKVQVPTFTNDHGSIYEIGVIQDFMKEPIMQSEQQH